MSIGTIFVLLVIVIIVTLAVRTMIKDKKSGKSSCGGDCSKCSGCH